VFVAVGKKNLPRYWVLKGSEVGNFCDNHPTMKAARLSKPVQERFENRWSILDEYEGIIHYL